MIVLIFFTICQGTLLVMNYMLFPGLPSVWNQIGIPAAAISLFTEMALIVNCYRNSKNKVLEQEKERLELELNREKLETESAQMQSERLNRRREDLLRIVKAAENDLHMEALRKIIICRLFIQSFNRDDFSISIVLQFTDF